MALAVIGALFLLSAFGVETARAAQAPARDECNDPYGCTTTTPPPIPPAECVMSVSSGAPGTTVVSHVTNVPVNVTVTIAFDGTVVGSATSQPFPSALAPQTYGRYAAQVAAQTELGFADVTWKVPNVAPGVYSVIAYGPGFQCGCTDADGVLGFKVLASGGNGGGGGLVPTGAEIGLLIAIALLLLIVGRAFLEASRRRKKARAAAARRHARPPAGVR